MEEKLLDLFDKATIFTQANPLVACAVAVIYILFLFRKPGKTFKATLLLALLSIVLLWFWQMFDSRNNHNKWNKGDQKTLDRVEKAIKEAE